jgi:membrane fusion protein (multidrug efflux system)
VRSSPKMFAAFRRVGLIAVMVIVVFAAMAWLSGVFHRGKVQPGKFEATREAGSGKELMVSRVERPRVVEVAGSIQSESRTNIASRIVANVIEMKGSAGTRVKVGDVLVTLDSVAPKARVEQAREMLRSAEANRSLAQTELDRISTLRQTGAVSQNQIDEWETKLALSKSDVARSEQAIREAEVGLADAELKAPFDGVVIDRLAEPGDQAYPGRPLLTMYDPNRLRVEASVRESYTGRLKPGQKISVFIDSIGQERVGEVQQIVPASDPTSRSCLVKLHQNEPAGLYPGMYARMRVPLGTESRLEVPQSLVRRVGQLTFVEVLDDGHVDRRAVRLGRTSGDSVEVLAGLSEGERLNGG